MHVFLIPETKFEKKQCNMYVFLMPEMEPGAWSLIQILFERTKKIQSINIRQECKKKITKTQSLTQLLKPGPKIYQSNI